MTIYFRRRDVPELAGLPRDQASLRLRQAQEHMSLKMALLSSALFGGITLIGAGVGYLLGQQLVGVLAGWLLGMWMYSLVKLNAARPWLKNGP